MLAQITIAQPSSVQEASSLLREMDGQAVVYAGGTELLVLMKERLLEVSTLVDIKKIPGLNDISVDMGNQILEIGALVTHRQLEKSPVVQEHAPLLAQLEAHVANIRVRNAGTIGGNLCFAEPHSDPATLLVAWEATFELASDTGTRRVPAPEFFGGYLETDRKSHELLTRIEVPLCPPNTKSTYERFKTHERPVATVAAVVSMDNGTIEHARVVAGCVGPHPQVLPSAGEVLAGAEPTDELVDLAAAYATETVKADDEGFESAEYKRHLTGVLTRRALRRAIEQVE